MAKFHGEQVISGTFGEAWLDGEYVAEVMGLEAKLEIEKEDVPLSGKFATDSKFMGYKGSGTLRMHKANSRMIKLLGDKLKQGINPRFQIVSSLADPSAAGAERVIIKDASFNDLSLINWELKKKGEVEAPFTFTDWTVADAIEPAK
ncbi:MULTISPECIES: phage tail tube protein [unclassified Paenibacillus]|uniref:phage tail tube protein n=1 Tax=unclassified Paenibacillus TaxID=185978 RepID=UPI001C0F670C|nr:MULTISPECIES: phage tail tube protein [unclassified Paenibacillus]MBU5444318.1 phage tail tube protein [Paenibacillus sp. MSJ-34]CAH0121047.1 Phage-like element PBSX protein XkdM [Paenibacillus sp. CECT 9249]